MKTIGLVSCAAKKQDGRHPAREIYVSALFSKSVRYIEQNVDDWYILSAKFGLLNPSTVIEKYDVTLNRMPIAKRRMWAEQVFSDLIQLVEPGDNVIILAGQNYVEFFMPKLVTYGVLIDRPLDRLKIGQQLSWLNEHNIR